MAMGIASLFLAMTHVSHAGTMVYVSNADSQEISVLELDRAQGQLKAVETVAVGGTVMPMVLYNGKYVEGICYEGIECMEIFAEQWREQN